MIQSVILKHFQKNTPLDLFLRQCKPTYILGDARRPRARSGRQRHQLHSRQRSCLCGWLSAGTAVQRLRISSLEISSSRLAVAPGAPLRGVRAGAGIGPDGYRRCASLSPFNPSSFLQQRSRAGRTGVTFRSHRAASGRWEAPTDYKPHSAQGKGVSFEPANESARCASRERGAISNAQPATGGCLALGGSAEVSGAGLLSAFVTWGRLF